MRRNRDVTGVGQKMARGATWMVAFRFADRSFGIVSTAILARLLIPADFGLVAMAMSVIAILELMGAFGFDFALITRPSAERRHYDTAWTFNALFGLFCALALLLLAYPAAAFFHEPRLAPVVLVLAISSLIQGFENVGVVAFRKELQFDREFRFLMVKRLATFAATIPLAFLFRSYWALVVGILVGRTTSVAMSYLAHPYRPRFSLAARSELLQFSKWLLINNLLVFGRERGGDIIVGRIAGPASLGIYNMAYELSFLPATDLVAPINRAVFPGYTKVAADPAVLRDHFLRVMALIALLVIPAGLGITATAALFVPLLLGEKWDAAIPIVQILGIAGMIGAAQTNFGSLYIAIGRPRITSIVTLIHVGLLLPSLIVLTSAYGTIGSAAAVVSVAAVMVAVSLRFLAAAVSATLRDLWRVLHRPAIAGACMFAVVKEVIIPTFPVAGTSSRAAVLLLCVAAGAATYAATVWALWKIQRCPAGVEQDLLAQWRQRLAQRPAT